MHRNWIHGIQDRRIRCLYARNSMVSLTRPSSPKRWTGRRVCKHRIYSLLNNWFFSRPTNPSLEWKGTYLNWQLLWFLLWNNTFSWLLVWGLCASRCSFLWRPMHIHITSEWSEPKFLHMQPFFLLEYLLLASCVCSYSFCDYALHLLEGSNLNLLMWQNKKQTDKPCNNTINWTVCKASFEECLVNRIFSTGS